MQELSPGHRYELENFIQNSEPKQVIQFIEKTPNAEDPTKLDLVSNGTTNEEVLKMLIIRTEALNKLFPCRDNSIAITHMEDALMRFEKRTRDRVARNVEGTHLK